MGKNKETSKEPAVFHIFEEQIFRTFDYDKEQYAVYSFTDDPELVCSRIDKRDIRTVAADIKSRSGIVSKALGLFNKGIFATFDYFGLNAPSGDVYAVLAPKYDYIPSVQGFAYHWGTFRKSIGEEAALSLMKNYLLTMPDEKLYEYFFDGYKGNYVMDTWEKVESGLKSADVDNPEVFDLLRKSQNLLEEATLIHNRNEKHSAELQKLRGS